MASAMFQCEIETYLTRKSEEIILALFIQGRRFCDAKTVAGVGDTILVGPESR
jgi:hypothetical protein